MTMSDVAQIRVVLVATGDIALPVLRYLLEHGPRPLALVTQPDKPVGRHQTLMPPIIKRDALKAGIPVWQPPVIGTVANELAALEPDVIVVMAYGQILRHDILALADRSSIINLHASLLPRHRGASCIQAAIDAGDQATGVTAMHIVRELDAGDVIVSKAIQIDAAETAGSLHDRLADLAPQVLAEALAILASATPKRMPQNHNLACYAPKLERDDGKIDWSLDAVTLERRIRAYDPWPGTFTVVGDAEHPKRLKIFPPTEICECELQPGEIATCNDELIIGCGTAALRMHEVQPDGAKRMRAADYLRGRQPR
jgi:methionyl-tRNA formyltransferase